MQPKSGEVRRLFQYKAPSCSLKPAALLVLAGSLLLAATGCGSRPTTVERPTRPYQGAVVRVACPGEPVTTLVTRYGQAWSADSGARVEVTAYDPSAGPEGAPADVWVIPPARMPHWAAAGQLREVPASYRSADAAYGWDDLLPLYRYKLLTWDQKVYALPLLGDVLLCFYRTDLFQAPRHREAFKKQAGRDLAEPDTWEKFAAAAAYFHGQPRPGIDHPCPSLPPLPAGDDDLDRLFYTAVVPFARQAVREDAAKPPPSNEVFSFHYDLQTGEPRIDTAGFVHGLKLLQHLQSFRPGGTAAEPAASFEKGEAALCLASPSWIARFQQSTLVRGKFGFRRLPSSTVVFDYLTGKERSVEGSNYVPYLGAEGWVAVVPSTAEHADAAFALIAHLSDPRTSRDVVIEPSWGGGVFRREHLDGRSGWQAFGLDPARTQALVQELGGTVMFSRLKNPVLRLRTPDERPHQRTVLAEVRAALLQGKDAAQALHDAAAQWKKLDAAKEAKVRDMDYRLSLSLSRND
jgi:multiple sugar transport system substrate-binding protein